MSKPTYVPVKELAEHLSVSVVTIQGWVKKKAIPQSTYIKVGNTYRFNLSAVINALTSGEEEPPEIVIPEPTPPIRAVDVDAVASTVDSMAEELPEEVAEEVAEVVSEPAVPSNVLEFNEDDFKEYE